MIVFPKPDEHIKSALNESPELLILSLRFELNVICICIDGIAFLNVLNAPLGGETVTLVAFIAPRSQSPLNNYHNYHP